MKKTILLFSVIILAFFLRVYILDQVPAGFDSDEAEFAFNSYTLSKYLKNENNEFFPYQVNTYGNYRPLGLPYLIAISIIIFGNTIFAVRLPNTLAGVCSVILICLFVKKLFKNEKVALAAGFLSAISPWNVILSRGTAEPVLATCFILLLLIEIINYWEKRKTHTLFLVYVFSFVSFFTYTGVLPLIFLLSFVLIFYLFVKLRQIHWMIVIPFMALVIFPIVPIFITNPGYLNGRFKQTSIFTGIGKLGIDLVTKEQQQEVLYNRINMQGSINQFFHNVNVNTFNTILNNWTKHFSFDYLYFNGGEPRRLQVPNTGVFLLIESVFLAGGIILLAKKRHNGILFLAIFIILISFLPAGLTSEEVPSTHRPIFATVGFFLIEGYFLYCFGQKKNVLTNIFSVAIMLVFAEETVFYLHNYLIMQPRHNNSARHYAMREVARLIGTHENEYDGIYVVKSNTEPAYFYYFFNRLDPLPYLLNKEKNHRGNWSDGNIHYIHFACADVEIKAKKPLIIEEANYCGTEGELVEYIYNSDGVKMLRAVER